MPAAELENGKGINIVKEEGHGTRGPNRMGTNAVKDKALMPQCSVGGGEVESGLDHARGDGGSGE